MRVLTEEQKVARRATVKRWKEANREKYLAGRKKVDACRRLKRKTNPVFKSKWEDYRNQWRNSPEQKAKARAYYLRKRSDPVWLAEMRRKSNERRRNNKPEMAAYARHKRRIDPSFKLADNLRRRINSAIRGSIKSASTIKLLGCSVESFKMYFESKFTPGMSWEAFLRGEIHVDHIMPCSIFDLTRPDQQKACFHFSNLQPLWAKDNLSKHNKVVTNQFQLL